MIFDRKLYCELRADGWDLYACLLLATNKVVLFGIGGVIGVALGFLI